MKINPQKHQRRSIRLPGYDYSQLGAYFITIVAYQQECLFGEVIVGEMRLNENGKIVQWEWERLPNRFSFIELGTYIVMPNHFHGILIFHEPVRATRAGQIDSKPDNNTPHPSHRMATQGRADRNRYLLAQSSVNSNLE